MNTPQDRKGADQRKKLNKSEKKASEPHPENFKDEETGDKVVEILPIDAEGAAIKGIDPEK